MQRENETRDHRFLVTMIEATKTPQKVMQQWEKVATLSSKKHQIVFDFLQLYFECASRWEFIRCDLRCLNLKKDFLEYRLSDSQF